MSRFGEIRLDWGGEPDRLFRLGIGEIGRLQEKVDAGPFYIAAMCMTTIGAMAAMNDGDFGALSRMNLRNNCVEKPLVREVILQALLGTNMPMPQADRLVRTWVDERPLNESIKTALLICQAAVSGVEDEHSAGEQKAAEDQASSRSPAASTDSERMASMPSGEPADSAPLR